MLIMGKQLRDLLNAEDYKIVATASGNIGNNPTRADIETILTNNGVSLPTKDVTFYLVDTNDHNFQVSYISSLDTYFYTSMKSA